MHHSRRPLYAERLLLLLYRRISLGYYRRSRRFVQHRLLVGEQATLPVPDLVDLLAVYLSQRLPARLVARLGADGLCRVARVLHAVLVCGEFVVHLALRILWLLWQPIKRWRARRRSAAARGPGLSPRGEGVAGVRA